MLARSQRLRRSGDFSVVVQRGVRAASRTLVVHALGADPAEPTRVGFVVSRTVGNAVTRNRVKRRLRHLARPLATDPGLAVVIRANPAAATAGSAQLAADLRRCWTTAEDKVA